MGLFRFKCECSKTPDTLFYSDANNRFLRNLEQIEVGNWIRLYKCKKCGALWTIDEWDKYHFQVICKIDTTDNWQEIDTSEGRKKLLIKSRGGLTDDICIWANCNKRCVKGVVYCVDHLYKSGAQK